MLMNGDELLTSRIVNVMGNLLRHCLLKANGVFMVRVNVNHLV